MSEWKEATIGELAEKIAMGPFGSNIKIETFKPYGIPIISGTHLCETRMRDKDFNFISKEHADRLANSNVFRGDVIFTHAGNIGQVSFIPKNSKYERYIISQRQFYLRCNSNVLDYEYITYYFKSPYGQYQLLANANQTGVPSLAQPVSYLKSIKILLPPLPEQRAIASVLSSLDDKIDLLHRENKTLEAMAETLFRQWFIEEADEDWKEGTISDIIDILSGFPFRSDTFVESGKYRLITIKSVQDGYLELSNTDMISDIPPEMPKYCYLKQGDILLTLTGNVGRCCLVDSDDLLLNQRVAKLKPKNNRDIAYTYVFFRMEKTKRLLEEMAKGTAQPNLSPVETAQMEILIPSSDKLEFFSDVANPLIQKLLNNRIQIHTLEKLRDTLLPKLMSGEVRIQY